MKPNMYKLYAVAALLALANLLQAQQYRLQGRIINEASEAIAGAALALQRADSLVGATLTGENGGFEIKDLPKGEYKLTISSLEYEPLEEYLVLDANRRAAYVLLPLRQVELSGVEVTADRGNVIRQTATGTVFQLSAAAKSSNNPYEALREIPKLIVVESERKIQTADGKAPLILVNGIKRPAGIDAIDPQDIESVEVIDFPPARYLADGASTALNIKVKRKQYQYHTISANARHSLPLMNGNTYALWETGAARYSISLLGQHYYFSNDKMVYVNEQSAEAYHKTSQSERQYNMQTFYAALGGDYVFSGNDYLAYHITYTNTFSPPTETTGSGLYTAGGNSSAFDTWNASRDTYFLNTCNLYHKHDFDSRKTLETTLRFNINGNKNSGQRKETYSNLPPYDYLFDYDNSRLSAYLELNYSTTLWNQALDLGNYTVFRKDRIEQLSQPVFPYREWFEYLYADLSGSLGKKFVYSASLGTDLIFNRSNETENQYVKLKVAASIRYQPNSLQSFALAYRRDNTAPTIGVLNPYNTSTDSLYRMAGNPYLLPEQKDGYALTYSLNKNGLYLSPSLSYALFTDNIVESGRMHDHIFVRSYVNEGRYSEWDGGLTLRYNHTKWGSIGGTAGYRHSYYSQTDKGAFYTNLNFNLRYRKLSANGFLYYQRYYHSPLYTLRNYAPESELTFAWRLNGNLSLTAGMRYFLGGLRSESITEYAGYYARSEQKYIDRRFLPTLGFAYYFRNKVQTPQRNKKQLRESESGISL
jgi:hypothetical protein